MGLIFDAFWRSVVYCLHPRVIALSFLPLVVMVALSFGLGYFYWEDAVSAVTQGLEASELLTLALGWLDSVGLGRLRAVFAPLVVLFLATPVIVVMSLLLVSLVMTPALVELVAQRRFPLLERKKGASWLGSAAWSLVSTALALMAMVASLPLWLIPPLVMVLPPLIWGWLTYRVFAYDALADHASVEERRALFAQYRLPLLTLGVLTGYLGALPSVLWASGAMFIAMAPILVPLAIWLYTLVFAFSSLWFVHFCLSALAQRRQNEATVRPVQEVHPVVVDVDVSEPDALLLPPDAVTPPDAGRLPPP
ncbi:MAG TPA: EI24 domain-containing protein [Burkholderiaceae bacterium]|nr:EI24 domain-containing protein [Burkholderiaceae bacterium]